MKKTFFILSLITLVFVPTIVSSHTADSDYGSGYMMMQHIEDQALGDDLHEEMEELMVKMMSGNMTESEANRMVELMDEYPGPGSMMMDRMTGGYEDYQKGFGMMGGMYGGNYSSGLFNFLLWVLVIAGIAALIKYIVKK